MTGLISQVTSCLATAPLQHRAPSYTSMFLDLVLRASFARIHGVLYHALQVVQEPASKKGRCANIWHKKHATIREAELGEETDATPWNGQGRETLGLHTERGIDLVNICWAIESNKAKAKGEAVPEHLVVDTSQCVTRRPWSYRIRSMTTTSCFFHFSSQRCIVAAEHFKILGFEDLSPECLDRLSEKKLKDLCGESMSPPCVGLAAASLLVVFRECGLWERDLF